LTEIEAIFRTRPIAPLFNDPDHGSVLTPAHLPIDGPLLSTSYEYFQVSTAKDLTQLFDTMATKNIPEAAILASMATRLYIHTLQTWTKWTQH